MMAALKNKVRADLPAFASLEEYMACGVGACLGCVAAIQDGAGVYNKPVCKDGPVFDLHKVVF
jgi:dihydroorotate dehydrogenase electron transfer subunit